MSQLKEWALTPFVLLGFFALAAAAAIFGGKKALAGIEEDAS